MSYKVKIASLVPDPTNPRFIEEEAFEGLKRSIASGTLAIPDWDPDDGYRLLTTITVNKRNRGVVGGHKRLEAIQALGQDWIHESDISWIDLDENSSEKDLHLVNLNNTEISGQWTEGAVSIFRGLEGKIPEFTQLRLDSLLSHIERTKPWDSMVEVKTNIPGSESGSGTTSLSRNPSGKNKKRCPHCGEEI